MNEPSWKNLPAAAKRAQIAGVEGRTSEIRTVDEEERAALWLSARAWGRYGAEGEDG